MENKKDNEVVTIDRNEIKSEIRSAFSEVIAESFTNIGVKLSTVLFGGAESAQHTTPTSGEVKETVIETPLPPKDELVKIVTGFLYMAFGELKYERKDIIPVIQRIEKYMNNNDYDTALSVYDNAENEFLAAFERTTEAVPSTTSYKIGGIEVPAKFYNFSIAQLHYENNFSGGKLTASLKKKGITHIRDFFKPENSNLGDVLSVKGKKSFIQALERTISDISVGENSSQSSTSTTAIPKRDVYEINGVVIPESMLDKRISSLEFQSKTSRTKITKKIHEHRIIYLRDFFREDIPPLYKILSQGGKKSFLEVLKNSV